MTSWRRAAVVVAGLAGLAGSTLAASQGCGGDDAMVRRDAATTDVATLEAGGPCPNDLPPVGARCASPEGTSCAYGCAGYATCALGIWRVSANIPGVVCPEVEPTVGTPCPACLPAGQTCDYAASCADPGAGAPRRARTSCAAGRWAVELSACPEVGDAAADSGDGANGAADAADAADAGAG